MTTNENIKTINESLAFIDEDKNTHLHHEAANGNLEKVSKLLEGKCKIDPTNFLDWTPLMMAARNGHLEVVQHLIERGADATRENKFGYSVLLMAVSSGDLKVLHVILNHLLSGGVSKRSMQKFFSPLSLAVLFSYQHIVEFLIENGFCVNAVGLITDSTPLAFANSMGNIKLSQYLISKGAKIINHGIIENSNQPNKHLICKPPVLELPPIVLVSSPQVIPPPMNPVLHTNSMMEMPRRSSDLNTPVFTPHLSPFSPTPYMQQIFFPPQFSPNHFVPPGYSYDFLNMQVVQPNYYSPLTPVYAARF